MQLLLSLLAFAAGVVLPVQVGVNATLRGALGNPVMAALTSFLVGSLGLFVFLLVTRASVPAKAALAVVPAWAWVGGLLGAFYVSTTIVVGPRLGAAALLSLSVLGQLVASLVIDHNGWLGFPTHPISLMRLSGALLVFGGVILTLR